MQDGEDDMYDETKRCQTEEMLIDLVEDALGKLNNSTKKPVLHLSDAHMGLIAARALWDEHKMVCPVCSKQVVN